MVASDTVLMCYRISIRREVCEDKKRRHSNGDGAGRDRSDDEEKTADRFVAPHFREYKLPILSEEAIGAANGEMARIHQIVRKPMPSL